MIAAVGSTDVATFPSAAVAGVLPIAEESVMKLEDEDSGVVAGEGEAESVVAVALTGSAVERVAMPTVALAPASVVGAMSNILIECPPSRASTTATGWSACNVRSA